MATVVMVTAPALATPNRRWTPLALLVLGFEEFIALYSFMRLWSLGYLSLGMFAYVVTFALLMFLVVERDPKRGGRMPGTRLQWLAEFFSTPSTFHSVFLPLLGEMRSEYSKALAEGRWVKAAWVRLRDSATLWCRALMRMPVGLVRLILSAFKLSV